MIEKFVQEYLSDSTNIPVYMEKESDMPEEYFLIEKTGGGEVNYVRQATVAVKSYSSSMYKASCLNEKLKDAMRKIIETNKISKCSLNSDYPYSDTRRKKYRYQAVFNITYF